MKSRCSIFLIPLIILQIFFLAWPPYSADEDLFGEDRRRGVAFMSGGVSQREREILKERGKGYSLKLIFSSKKKECLSDVIVKVLDQKNQTILIAVSNGPWLFIDLLPGTYKMEASFRGDRKRTPRTRMEEGKQKVIHLRWQLKNGIRKDLLIPLPKPPKFG